MRRLFVLAALVLAASACSSSDSSDSATTTERTAPPDGTSEAASGEGTLQWEPCDIDLECAELEVPLDHGAPTGDRITIALARHQAGDPTQRVGALLVNPGGPGGSGIDLVARAESFIGDDVLERFDVVGFDPRGVGASTPVECTDDLDFLFSTDTKPDDELEREELHDAAQTLATFCEQNSAELLPHLGAQNVARDMDMIRAALGEEQLDYLGFSYGTYLGTIYAELFPGRVRAFVLDGAVDPSLDPETAAIQQSQGFEEQFEQFLDACAAESDCPFHSDGDPELAYDGLVAEVEAEGIAGPDGRVLGPGEFDIAVVTALYDGRQGFEALAQALADGADGDPEVLFRLFDSYVGRDASGSYDNSQEAFLSISCVDGTEAFGPDQFEAMAERVGEAAPRFGETGVNLGLACAYWPVAPSGLPGPYAAAGAAPILVIGTQGDPATPPEWAEALADQLDSGVLLQLDARGHTAYGQGYDCIDDAVTDYLVDLELPPDGTVCEV